MDGLEQGSSLLRSYFSIVLNLAPLQVQNSPPSASQTVELAAAPLDKNVNEKYLFALQNPASKPSQLPESLLHPMSSGREQVPDGRIRFLRCRSSHSEALKMRPESGLPPRISAPSFDPGRIRILAEREIRAAEEICLSREEPAKPGQCFSRRRPVCAALLKGQLQRNLAHPCFV
jgi:hypothetical protein